MTKKSGTGRRRNPLLNPLQLLHVGKKKQKVDKLTKGDNLDSPIARYHKTRGKSGY